MQPKFQTKMTWFGSSSFPSVIGNLSWRIPPTSLSTLVKALNALFCFRRGIARSIALDQVSSPIFFAVVFSQHSLGSLSHNLPGKKINKKIFKKLNFFFQNLVIELNFLAFEF